MEVSRIDERRRPCGLDATRVASRALPRIDYRRRHHVRTDVGHRARHVEQAVHTEDDADAFGRNAEGDTNNPTQPS